MRKKLKKVIKSISKKVKTFMVFLCLRNGKYVSNIFFNCFYLICHEVEIIVAITYSSFIVFFHEHGKSLSKAFYLQEIENFL